jgi:hypothetical protein
MMQLYHRKPCETYISLMPKPRSTINENIKSLQNIAYWLGVKSLRLKINHENGLRLSHIQRAVSTLPNLQELRIKNCFDPCVAPILYTDGGEEEYGSTNGINLSLVNSNHTGDFVGTLGNPNFFRGFAN